MAGFHEVQFPTDVQYGSSGGPGYSTNVIETDSGKVETVSRWEDARRRYNAGYGIRTLTQLVDAQKFYLARGGPANGFRFKDWLDYTSNPVNPSYEATSGVADQQIGVGDGATTTFQLIKTYTSGLVSKTRKINKPVTGTVRIYFNGVLQASGWSVDTTTGLITFTVAPTAGVVITASFEFDVPVRFGKELDEVFAASIDSFSDGSIPQIPLVEDVDPDPGYVGEYFYGGAYEVSITANVTMSTGLGRLWSVAAAASLAVILPNPANIPPGGPIFFLVNAGSNTFALKDHLGTTLVNLTAGQSVEILLTVQSGGTKVWYAI